MELTLDVPSKLNSDCKSRDGVKKTPVEGSLTFDAAAASSVICAAAGPINIYTIDGSLDPTDPQAACENSQASNYEPIYGPTSITAGPDGALWFIDAEPAGVGTHTIGRITTTGETTFYPTAPAGDPIWPVGGYDTIAVGSDGALWYVPECACIGHMTTDGSATSFSLPSSYIPTSITAGSDGALWFTFESSSGNGIGRITSSGQITTYTDPSFGTFGVGSASQFLTYITSGPDGALWFENAGVFGSDQCSIESITTSGVVNDYRVCGGDLTAGPDGEIWFANGNTIGEMTTSGVVTNMYSGSGIDGPLDMMAGSDGAVWFTNYGGPGSIGRITTDGTVTTYTNFYMMGSTGITTGPDGAVWFTDFANDTIGQIAPP